MANDKYVKLIKQYSEDGGNTWYDSNPPEYKRGDLIETDSPDCGAAVLQYRWFAKGEDYYTCEGYNKYYKEWYQYSYNGEDWFDVFPEQTRNGSLIEQNSIDCDYGVEWIPVEDQYICTENGGDTPEPEPSECTFTYELEDIGTESFYRIGMDKAKSYPKKGVDIGYNCIYDLNFIGCKYLELKSDRGIYDLYLTTVHETKPTIILPTPKFEHFYDVVKLSLFTDTHTTYYDSSNINFDSIINCPNTVYSSPDRDGRVYKIGGYRFDIHGVILDNKLMDHILYDTSATMNGSYDIILNYYNFRDRVIRIDGYDYRLSRTGTEDFYRYPNRILIESLFPFGNPSFERRIEFTNFKIANRYRIWIEDADYVLIDGIDHITINENPSEVMCKITAKKEITLKNIKIDKLFDSQGESEDIGVTNGFTIQYNIYDVPDEQTETIVNLENISLPITYAGRIGDGRLIFGTDKHHFKVHMTNCNETVKKLVENSIKAGNVELV